ncbi:hypothetical protein [Staphylococcus phage vB_Sau_P68]|nr:hypothetical protein [Staphylococcus phage vB_Sau_P68]
MRDIRIVKREITEVKEMIKHNENSKAQASSLQMRLLELQKERQAINWS